MPFIGNQPATSFEAVKKDRFTGLTGTSVTLSHAVSTVEDIVLWINAVKQDYTSYSVSGTALTVGGSLVSSDIVEVAYLGRTFQTVNPPAGSVGASQISDGSIALGKLSATGTKDATTFLRGDNTFAEPSAGLVKLINTTTTDATASFITFNSTYINSTYDNYFITFKTKPATDNVDLKVEFSTSGTFNTGGSDYGVGLSTEGTDLNVNTYDAIAINSHTNDGIGNGASEGGSGHCFLSNPADASQITALSSMINYRNFNTFHGMSTGGGVRLNAEANDGIRFYWSSGNFASGSSITLYGVSD